MDKYEQPVLVETREHVEIWTLNLPQERNPISDERVVSALVENVTRVNLDKRVRAIVLTGAGSVFSAGGNVKDMQERRGMFGGTPYDLRDGYRNGIQRIPHAVYNCEVPIVAAVNGPAVGAGCDLAVMCDLKVASTDAWFAESFVRLGIIPGDGGAWFLTRALTPARAAEMALIGDRITAEKALEWGLVNKVVAPEEVLDAALAYAQEIAKNPPHSVRMAKKLLRASQEQNLAQVLELSAAMQALAHHTADHEEAISALLEKRQGEYQGK